MGTIFNWFYIKYQMSSYFNIIKEIRWAPQDLQVAGSSLTKGTPLHSWARQCILSLVLVQPRKGCNMTQKKFLGIERTTYNTKRFSSWIIAWQGLTHIILASFLWDIGKQWPPRSEAAFWDCVIWLGSPLFAYIYCSIKIWIKMKNTTQQPLKQK